MIAATAQRRSRHRSLEGVDEGAGCEMAAFSRVQQFRDARRWQVRTMSTSRSLYASKQGVICAFILYSRSIALVLMLESALAQISSQHEVTRALPCNACAGSRRCPLRSLPNPARRWAHSHCTSETDAPWTSLRDPGTRLGRAGAPAASGRARVRAFAPRPLCHRARDTPRSRFNRHQSVLWPTDE